MPSPSPCDEPFWSPAMSTISALAWTTFFERLISASASILRVGDRRDADVGLGRRVGMGGDRRVAPREGVEQGGLPGVGEADEAEAFHADR